MNPKPNGASVTVLDVGHGNCAVVRSDEGLVVVDAGPGSTLLEFLDAAGIYKIDAIYLSHADHDHIGGAIAVLSADRFRVGCVHVNQDSFKDTGTWSSLKVALGLNQAKLAVGLASGGRDDLTLGRVKLCIVSPPAHLVLEGVGSFDRHGKRITTNTLSASVRIDFDSVPAILLAADIDAVALANRTSDSDFRAPILVFPHHGGAANSSGDEFVRLVCELVQPKSVVFSIGRGKFGTPRPEVITALRAHNPNVNIACTQLSEHCCAVLPNEHPVHLQPLAAAGRPARKCCAGTMVVELESARQLPVMNELQAFVDANVPNALCRR